MARILLADDDAATRDLVARALTGAGHQVTACADGQEALDRLTAAPSSVDLLLADVQMPGLDGIELAERARALVPGLRCVLMSALTGELARAERLKREGGVRLLAKPFTLEQMRSEALAALA